MASMASSSPRGSEGESSAEEYDSSIENGMEKFEKDVNERNQEENNPPKKKKKRVAGDRSGRQLALRRIKAEKKKNLWETFGPSVPSFAEVAKASRKVLFEFAEDSDISEEHASAMRVYMNTKLGVSSTDGSNSVNTNIYKVALLPQRFFDLSMEICKRYDEGELIPPSHSGQRQRKTISNSSFNFLQGLNPLESKDIDSIGEKLHSWMATKIRPSQQEKTEKHAQLKIQAKDEKRKVDLKKEISALKKELKEEKAKSEKKKKEIVSLEKVLKEERLKSDKLTTELQLLKRNFRAIQEINQVLVSEMEALKEELEETKALVEQQNLDVVFTKEKVEPKPESANTWHNSHARHSAELQLLRKFKEREEQAADEAKEPDVDMGESEEQETITPKEPDVDLEVSFQEDGHNEFEIKEELIPPVACGHQFVAVAYSNCESFYLGQVLNRENGTFSISFLEGGDGEDSIYSWPSQMVVEQVAADQVFFDGIKGVEMDSNKLVFPQLKEIVTRFVPFKESLVEREKISQVKAVWDDISTPFRAFASGVTWKDIKTLQKGMPDLHESLMVSIFAPSVTWKSGWLNDAVMNAYLTALEKRANKNGKFVITANSFFIEKIKKSKQWRTRLDLSAYNKMLFPCQAHQLNHWFLGVVDIEKGTISQVDPLGGRNSEFFRVVRAFLLERKELEGRQWRELSYEHPLQADDISCGVFVLKIAECITERRNLEFSQNDIDDYRWQIAYRLINDGKW